MKAKSTIRALALIGSVLRPGLAIAQPPPVEARVQHFAQSRLESVDSLGPVNADVEVGFTLWHLRGIAPISFDEGRTMLILGPSYTGLNLSIAGEDSANIRRPETFHALALGFMLVHRFNESFSMVGGVIPALTGDLHEVSGDDLLVRTNVLALWRKSPDFTLGGGAALSTLLGRLQLVPLVQVSWRIDGPWYLRGILPAELDVGARWDRWRFSSRFRLQGGVYNLSRTELEDDALQFSVGTAGLTAAYRLGGPFWLEFEAGTTFLRRMEITVDGDADEGLDLGPSPFAGVAIRLEVPQGGQPTPDP